MPEYVPAKKKTKLILASLTAHPVYLAHIIHTATPETDIALAVKPPLTYAQETALQELNTLSLRLLGNYPLLITLPYNPAKAVETLVDILVEKKPAHITLDIGGADHYTTAILYTATLIYTAATGTPATIILDRTPEPVTLPLQTITTIIQGKLTPTQEQIAKTLTIKPQTIQEIAKQTGKAPTTIQRHIAHLNTLEMTTKQENTIIPTPWLRIYTKTHKQKNTNK